MANSEGEDTDGTPTKPVSSLRSHFENMARSEIAPRSPSLRTTPRSVSQYDRSQETQTLDRASLDIPRGAFLWGSSGGSSSEDTQRSPGLPVPCSQMSGATLRQRPISMNSLSPSRTLPTVKVEPPRPPPKSMHPPEVQTMSDAPSSNHVISVGYPQSCYPTPARPIPLPNRPSIRDSGFYSRSENETAAQSSIITRNITKFPRDIVAKSAPPPVNRAEKPNIPIKAPPCVSTSKLEPEAIMIDEGISPFSTPPSSDGSPEQLLSRDQANENRSRPTALGRERRSYFSAPPRHHVLQSTQHDQHNAWLQKSKEAGSQVKASPPIAVLPSDTMIMPPGLPPRRNVDRLLLTSKTSKPVALHTDQGGVHDASRDQGLFSNAIVTKHALDEITKPTSGFSPPPKRNVTMNSSSTLQTRASLSHRLSNALPEQKPKEEIVNSNERMVKTEKNPVQSTDFPDSSNGNRRPPYIKQGIREIETHYDTRLFDMCGQYLCTTGYLTRAWDLLSGDLAMSIGHGEKEIRITALAFKPGATVSEEGMRVWLGNNCGDIQEVDISTQSIVSSKLAAHGRREIVKIYRHQNSMWTLDDDGKLYVWPPDKNGLPGLHCTPSSYRVPRGHTFSIVIQDTLWLATGKDIRVFRPGSHGDVAFTAMGKPMSQSGVGEVTSGAVISGHLDRVYFGHADGKVTVYSTIDFSCLSVINVSVYKISSLAGAGSYLWAGYNTGMIYVYDTRTQPWTTKKDWHAHDNPVANIIVDGSSIWQSGLLRVASIGTDNAVRLWDGTLEDDWLENDMGDHDTDYCEFREIKTVVVTWNVGAATPTTVRYEEKDSSFFREVLQVADPPDLLVFGFQELVDLEDKKLTAKSFFRGNKRKDPSVQEHMSRQYREWRDFLIRCIEDNMPANEPYYLLHTASMVGLFSCVFIKASQRSAISDVSAAEVKRGMGGLHGNKGALILRFLLDNTSLCLVNCHLAAGQSQTVHRNNDVAAILDSALLPPERDGVARLDTYTGGGDGSMILDHEICILNGDLNYRIDTMGRDTVIKSVNKSEFGRLLERDQLLVSRRRHPGFRLRTFTESPITFAPTYKYDIGSNRYDTSEKHRAPAWCDRIMYRGAGKIKQLEYRRHETQVSDHRPVSGTFRMRIKSVSPEKRERTWKECARRFELVKQKLETEAKVAYLRDILGVDSREAKELL